MEKWDLMKLIEIVIRNAIWMRKLYVLEVTGGDTQRHTHHLNQFFTSLC